MHCLSKMCSWCVCIALCTGLIFFVCWKWMRQIAHSSGTLRLSTLLSWHRGVSSELGEELRGWQSLHALDSQGWHAIVCDRKKEKSSQWNQGDCISVSTGLNDSFERLHSVYVSAENKEAWTHYSSTDLKIYVCLKRFRNISAFHSSAKKGAKLSWELFLSIFLLQFVQLLL